MIDFLEVRSSTSSNRFRYPRFSERVYIPSATANNDEFRLNCQYPSPYQGRMRFFRWILRQRLSSQSLHLLRYHGKGLNNFSVSSLVSVKIWNPSQQTEQAWISQERVAVQCLWNWGQCSQDAPAQSPVAEPSALVASFALHALQAARAVGSPYTRLPDAMWSISRLSLRNLVHLHAPMSSRDLEFRWSAPYEDHWIFEGLWILCHRDQLGEEEVGGMRGRKTW